MEKDMTKKKRGTYRDTVSFDKNRFTIARNKRLGDKNQNLQIAEHIFSKHEIDSYQDGIRHCSQQVSDWIRKGKMPHEKFEKCCKFLDVSAKWLQGSDLTEVEKAMSEYWNPFIFSAVKSHDTTDDGLFIPSSSWDADVIKNTYDDFKSAVQPLLNYFHINEIDLKGKEGILFSSDFDDYLKCNVLDFLTAKGIHEDIADYITSAHDKLIRMVTLGNNEEDQSKKLKTYHDSKKDDVMRDRFNNIKSVKNDIESDYIQAEKINWKKYSNQDYCIGIYGNTVDSVIKAEQKDMNALTQKNIGE